MPDVRAKFERLFDIYDNVSKKSPSRPVKVRAAALDLLISLIDSTRHVPAKAPGKFAEIAALIQNHPTAEYPIKELAKECGVSIATFAKLFKRTTGLPLHAYLINCRINKAKDMLLYSRRSLSAIGQELGFCSPQHFAKTFKRIVGVNPQKYRTN